MYKDGGFMVEPGFNPYNIIDTHDSLHSFVNGIGCLPVLFKIDPLVVGGING